MTKLFPAAQGSTAWSRRVAAQALAGLVAAAFVAAAGAQSTGAIGKNDAQKQKLVIQVSDAEPAKWNLALNNAKNVQEELGADKVDIEIVAYGPGLAMLKIDAATNSRVSDAVKSGIAMVACENTMRVQKLTKDDMHPGVSYANSGVIEIMRLQRLGWSYVRP